MIIVSFTATCDENDNMDDDGAGKSAVRLG